MSQRLLLSSVMLFALTALVACGSGGGGSNQGTSSTETAFTSTVNSADLLVSQYASSPDPAGDADRYYARESDHLDHLSDLWDHMHSQCDEVADCPAGGGLTGDWDGHCMSNGHMLDSDQMNELHDRVLSARHALDDYRNGCGTTYDPDTCDARWQDHCAEMHTLFSHMTNDCSAWWSHEDGHWGNCGPGM